MAAPYIAHTRLESTLKARAHVFISGQVQGVFFRSQTQRKAIENIVTGWVRNLPDGKVEAVFEGERESVEKLVKFCKKGPPGANVAGVEVSFGTYAGDFREFKIYW